jgi:formylglycine-generating enzyme required for sulfatase activity
VGELIPNPFGLFDLHGNVWEWVQDEWGPAYYQQFADQQAVDPGGPTSDSSQRVRRGGRWTSSWSSYRSANRYFGIASHRSSNTHTGFRAVLTIDGFKQGLKNKVNDSATRFTWPDDAPSPAIAPFDAQEAKQHQQAWAKYLGVPVEREVVLGKDKDGNDVKVTMVLIPPGEFLMGSTDEEQTRFLEEAKAAEDDWAVKRIPTESPKHRARIARPFYLGKYETTQAQWVEIMDNNPARFTDDLANPVEQVSWEAVQPFIARLNERMLAERLQFKLPTEAQWEFACRAGTTTYWHGADNEQDLQELCWYRANSGNRTHPVGQLKHNAYGIYDLHGNVWEWCADWHGDDYYAKAPLDDPGGPLSGDYRARRGGSWGHHAGNCRSAYRSHNGPGFSFMNLGFRLAADLPEDLPGAKKNNDCALQFDGKGNLVEIPTLSYKGDKPVTFEARVKIADAPEGLQRIVSCSWGGLNVLPNGRLRFAAWDPTKPDTKIELISPAAIRPGVDTHIAMCWDGLEYRLFVNGELVARSQDVSYETPNEQGFWFGVSGDGQSGSYQGILDEVRIASIARYLEDFTPAAHFKPDEHTLALYHFDEGEGTVLKDSSGNEHHGEIIGAKWVKAAEK